MAEDPMRPRLPVEFEVLEAATSAALRAAERADEWDSATRARVLVLWDKVVDTALAGRATVVGAEQAAGTWSLAGDRDLAGFLGRLSHQGRDAGRVAVGQAVTLAAMPAVAGALVDGPVTARHVDQIFRATATSPALATELASAAGQARVVELARRFDGSEFGKQLRAMSAALDPATRQREHDEQRAGRYLTIAHTPGGTLVKAQLDNVLGRELAKVLDAHNPRPAVDDERDRGQRLADALGTMVRRLLSDKGTSAGSTAPVQAVVTFTQETWAGLRGPRAAGARPAGAEGNRPAGAGDNRPTRAGGDRSTGAGGDGPDPAVATWAQAPTAPRGSALDVLDRLRGVDPVLDEGGNPWPASEIARALCDCTLTRAVVGSDDQPLNLGRDQRLFTRAHWLALHASGVRSCSVDGCDMPLAFTELHHMRWWDAQAGRTDLANCAPECTFHHHEVHRLALTVTRRPDGTYEHRRPDGRLYGGAPPGGDPPGSVPLELLGSAERADLADA